MIALRKRRLRRIVAATLMVSTLGVVANGRADDTPSHFAGPAMTAPLLAAPAAAPFAARPVAHVPAGTPALRPEHPYWLELPASQRTALAPLVDDWERLDFQTKKKWVEIANRYPRMQPDEQARTQERMREWALLTPDQRRVARDSFARIHALPPEQRADLLRKYDELPPEKKKALANQAQVSKALVVPKPNTLLPAATVTRRAQIREGVKVRNPALAAAKSASPIIAPAVPKPVTATVPVAPSSGGFAPSPASSTPAVVTPAAAVTTTPASTVVAPVVKPAS